MKNNLVRVALVLALVVTLAGCDKQGSEGVIAPQGAPASSDFRHIRAQQVSVDGPVRVAVPTSVETATPVMVIDSAGALSNPLEIRKNGTPVFYVDVDGNATYTGFTSGGGLENNPVGVRAPTSVGTATPAFFADSAGGVSNPFEVRYSQTPVVVVDKTGNVTASGSGSFAGAGYFAVPTAVGTATPALFVNSAGGVGNLLELRQGGTPVVQVSAAGAASLGSTLAVSGMATMGRKVIAKTGTAVNLTAAEVAWTIVSDLGDTGGITITLPAAVAGMDVLLYNKTGNDWIVDCDNSDQIFDLTDAAGNKITNTTAFDYVHLVALDDTGWYTLDVHGTWTDAN